MKKIAVLVLAALSGYSVLAQDVIVKYNRDEIRARVLEVSPSEVRYKKLDNLEGPLFIISVDDVMLIRYANGQVDSLGQVRRQGMPAFAAPQRVMIEQRDPFYYLNGSILTDRALRKLIMESGNVDAIAALRSETTARRLGKVLIPVGLPIAGFGGLLMISSLTQSQSPGTSQTTLNEQRIVAGAMMLVGTTLAVIGFNMRHAAKARIYRAVQYYNSGIAASR